MIDPMDIGQAQVCLLVRLPGEKVTRQLPWLTLSEETAECLRPLPRNREIAWEIEDQVLASKMTGDRRRVLGLISDHLKEQLLRVVWERDPVNGRERGES